MEYIRKQTFFGNQKVESENVRKWKRHFNLIASASHRVGGIKVLCLSTITYEVGSDHMVGQEWSGSYRRYTVSIGLHDVHSYQTSMNLLQMKTNRPQG